MIIKLLLQPLDDATASRLLESAQNSTSKWVSGTSKKDHQGINCLKRFSARLSEHFLASKERGTPGLKLWGTKWHSFKVDVHPQPARFDSSHLWSNAFINKLLDPNLCISSYRMFGNQFHNMSKIVLTASSFKMLSLFYFTEYSVYKVYPNLGPFNFILPVRSHVSLLQTPGLFKNITTTVEKGL